MAALPPEIDLQDPEQLAALLNATWTDDRTSADQLTDQLATLVESDNPVFAHVGRVPTGDVPDGANEGDIPDGVDDVRPDDPTGLESAQSPIRSGNQPWYDWDRRRAKGKYTLYRLEAKHARREPIESVFTGDCQAVRVRLPATPVARDSYIGTYVGKVEASDHLLFSVQEVRDCYERAFGKAPRVARVELITGARYLGKRFSPVSIFLAYSDADRLDLPTFYILEGGSASGKPKALYPAKTMDAVIHQQAGFSFTPLTCAANWYEGGLEMTTNLLNPAKVYLTAAQQRDGKFDYLDLSVRYSIVEDPNRVVAPFELQVEAAMRVLAIAKQIGCELEQGSGMAPVLGPIAEGMLPWDIKPRGSANAGERARYCGCPKAGATSVDPTPPAAKPERARPTSSTQPATPTPPTRKPKPPT